MADWLNKGIKAVTGALKSMQGDDANDAAPPEETAPEKNDTATPVKRKPFKLKFSVPNSVIRKMAVKTLQAGGLEVKEPVAPPPPAPPADPFATSPRAAAPPRNIRREFNDNAAEVTYPEMAQPRTRPRAPTFG